MLGSPTGLGAAVRLQQLGHQNWTLLESTGIAGGLARSVVDSKGFVWDMGGHVIFSHYKYFDEVRAWPIRPRQKWTRDLF